MYGTVARMRIKPGSEAKLMSDMAQYDDLKIPGFREHHYLSHGQ